MKGSLIELSRRVLRPPNILNGRLYCSFPSPSSLPPNNKLFVAGLSWSVDEKSLNDAFSSFGQVTEGRQIPKDLNNGLNYSIRSVQKQVRIMYDKETGRSRGFGFVYFSKDEEAICAKDAMDGKALLGRPLRVSFALEKVRGAPVVVPRLTGTGNVDNKTR
ncbi:putative pyrophosphate--fructose 6-phosphate 1-phosphotransferase subunit beta-like [Capsicum annuum]|nr:putative pyrophosphate--fructose 6-phosphate 1-phosphotransferase subunit beta-like [Capsicum annuum]